MSCVSVVCVSDDSADKVSSLCKYLMRQLQSILHEWEMLHFLIELDC